MDVTGPRRRTCSLDEVLRTCSACVYYSGGGRSKISGVCTMADFARARHGAVFSFASACDRFAEGVVCYSNG